MASKNETEKKEGKCLETDSDSTHDEDIMAQKDEMMVMESILGQDTFIVYEGALLSGKILINVNVSDGFLVIETKKDEPSPGPGQVIKHLPPLTLHFTLSKNYPSMDKPSFTLSSEWLDRDSLSQLCNRLDEIWDADGGLRTEVLYKWYEFLKENSMAVLNIQAVYDTSACSASAFHMRRRQSSEIKKGTSKNEIHPKNCVQEGEPVHLNSASSSCEQESMKKGKKIVDQISSSYTGNVKTNKSEDVARSSSSSSTDSALDNFKAEYYESNSFSNTKDMPQFSSKSGTPSGKNNVRKHKKHYNRQASIIGKNYDGRAVFDTRRVVMQAGSVSEFLVKYDNEEDERKFSQSTQSCDVCLTTKSGNDFVRFKCMHAFCKECIKFGYTTHIREGAVDMIKCLAHKCLEVPSVSQVRAAVGEELYQRYDSILLQRALERMDDLVYCPREKCMQPVIRDTHDTLASCDACGYRFCCICKMVYHGVEPCRFKSEERKKIFEEYTQATVAEKILLEKTYGSKQIRMLVDTTLSEKWMAKQSKPCPHCKVPIEKFEGCNKVTCVKCSSFFCWICLSQLDRANPYHHFNDPTSSCFHNLFENANNGSDSEFSDEDDEDDDFDTDSDE